MNILISMCLLGICCRYDGCSKPVDGLWERLQPFHLVPVCPEQMGGLPTPRMPAECRLERVVLEDGTDVTAQYRRGAAQTLALAKRYSCPAAILKKKSPSCGSGEIYDGSFSHTLVPGWGVTAQLLQQNGIAVFDETQLDVFLRAYGTV